MVGVAIATFVWCQRPRGKVAVRFVGLTERAETFEISVENQTDRVVSLLSIMPINEHEGSPDVPPSVPPLIEPDISFEDLKIHPHETQIIHISLGRPANILEVTVVSWTGEEERAARDKYKKWPAFLRERLLKKFSLKPEYIHKVDIPVYRKPD
jgi:hypothetical protein